MRASNRIQDFRQVLALAGVAAAALSAAPAFAHHSFAMYDNQQSVTLEGTVKEFQWANPHIWVQVVVKDPATGKEVEWSVQGASPNGLRGQGWTRNSIKAGDKAKVVINPLKNGSAGGLLSSITVNGEKVGH